MSAVEPDGYVGTVGSIEVWVSTVAGVLLRVSPGPRLTPLDARELAAHLVTAAEECERMRARDDGLDAKLRADR